MKRFGVAAFEQDKQEKYDEVSATILEGKSAELDCQMIAFQRRFIEFAQKHNSEIRANPEFRSKFLNMCSSIGVDPLQLFDKDKHLLNIEDFYYEVCVKIIEICRETKDVNGGIISFDELRQSYFKHLKISRHDLAKSVDMLKVLDGGFETFEIRGKKFLTSVPNELTNDQTKILEICSILGYTSVSLLQANLGWLNMRSNAVLVEMVANGLLWVDEQAGSETLYWDPSWITRSIQ